MVFERAAAIDLAGRNVLEAVQMSVNPKVIETPVVAAVAKDGIEVKVKARVTVRANICLLYTSKEIAAEKGLNENGYRIVNNCKAHGGQEVFHIHFHLLGGEKLGLFV